MSSEVDLARLLPTCQRCRRLRRKCDTQLPACRLCQKGKAECTFFDHALQQSLPRTYVHQLMTRLDRLRALQRTTTGQIQSPTLSKDTPVAFDFNGYRNANGYEDELRNVSETSFDKHFNVFNANPTCWQFFGTSSFLALAVEVLAFATKHSGSLIYKDTYVGADFWLNAQSRVIRDTVPVSVDSHRLSDLLQSYLTSVDMIVPFVNKSHLEEDIEHFLMFSQESFAQVPPKDTHSFFRISMMCAIAYANTARHQQHHADLSARFYGQALKYVDRVTSDVTVAALEALMLLIIHSLFFPRQGDVWKLLDFACRLSIELGFHAESISLSGQVTNRTVKQKMFWSLFTIERTVAHIFGRPSDLPEDIVTVDYPHNLNEIPTALPEDHENILQSHHFRLQYLRSQVSQELYLPANPPRLSQHWYERKLSELLVWKLEFEGISISAPLNTITCQIGFEYSVCFLLQPLLLQALAQKSTTNIEDGAALLVPRDSYFSACHLIELYKSILRASEDSPLGRYPLLFVFANHIQVAAFTIMAHCQLALESTPQHSVELKANCEGRPDRNIDFSGIHELSGSCMYLLTRCAEIWKGMIGLADIYEKFAAKTLPALVERGLVT